MKRTSRRTLVVVVLAGACAGIGSACGDSAPFSSETSGAGGGGGDTGVGSGGATSTGSTTTSSTGGASGSAAAGTAGSATGGTSVDASSTGGSGGVAGTGNDSGSVTDTGTPACGVNAPCTNGPDPGICKDGMCVGCAGAVDDGACVRAYGAGHLCIEGACERADCRKDADCGDAGKICVNGACIVTGCHSDGDCTDPSKRLCDVPSATCISPAAACTTKSAGDSCAGAASKHLCCGATLECKAIDCCTSAQCPAGQMCTVQNTCASAGCPAVADHVYYVDAADPGTNGRTGSATCPFKSLTQALTFVTNPNNLENVSFNVSIVLRSGISEASEGTGAFPIYIPSRVVVQGASDVARPVVTVPNGTTGFIFNYPKPSGSQAFGGMSQLVIEQTAPVTDDTKQGFGIRVTGTHPNVGEPLNSALNVDINRVTLRRFRHAIHVDTGGFVGVGSGVSTGTDASTGNFIGVYADDGYVRVAAGSAGAPSHFDYSFHSGIYIGGASVLQVVGAPLAADAGVSGKTITADHNNYGVRFKSFGAIPAGIEQGLEHVQMNNNAKFDAATATTNGAGLFVYAGGNPFRVRSSIFSNNYQGVHVAPDSTATNPNDVSAIDLGTSAAAGNNALSGAKTLLCLGSFANMTTLRVSGNTWGAKSCLVTCAANICAMPAPKLVSAATCASMADVGFAQNVRTTSIDAGCAFQ